MSESGAQTNVLGFDRAELEELAIASGQPRYRGRQIFSGIYSRRAQDLAALTELGRDFRGLLTSRYEVRYPKVLRCFDSRDGSARYLLGLADGQAIEAVYMPEKHRITLCLSSQAGCAVGCRFCFTGLLGVARNLKAGEMIGQALTLAEARNVPPRSVVNVVFMGMGEPLLNLGEVMKAVKILTAAEGVGISWRRITISTSGIVPGIRELGREPMRPKLAVSLNGSTEEQRTALMPINRKYPLRELLEACRAFPLRPRERLTFEYVLLEGINDSDDDAARVAELMHAMPAKVNLIPYNSGAELPYRAPRLERVLAFQQVLAERHVPAFIRNSRGQDIGGACGQLRLEGAPEAARALGKGPHLPR